MFAWMTLFALQVGLVSAKRTALHRKRGKTAFGLIPLIMFAGHAGLGITWRGGW